MRINSRLFLLASLMIIASLLVFACAGAQKKTSNASIVVEPVAANPAAAINVSGKGFQPNEEIDILFVLEEHMKIGIGTEKVDIIKADGQGNFTVNAAVPMNAKPGKYKIEVIGNKDSFTTTSIEVTPKKK